MNLLNAVPDFVKGAFGLVDKFVLDKDKAAELKDELSKRSDELQSQLVNAQRDIIVAEAQSGSWLTQNWRPLVMIEFSALIAAHWLGFTPENLGEAEILMLLGIVKVGLGGYVVGRSAEKAIKSWKAK